MNQISPFTSIIKEAWCTCGVHQLSSQKKRFDHHHERGKKYTNERKKKKKRSQSSSKKSLSRERVRERERTIGRAARVQGGTTTRKKSCSRFVLSPRVSFFCEESRLLGVSKAFESRLSPRERSDFFFPSLLTDFRRRGDTHGKKDGRKSLEVNGTEENPHRTH